MQGRGTSPGGDEYSSFQIRLKKLTTQQQNKLSEELTTKVHAVAPGVKNVSSSFGKQIARSAIIAVLFSLLVITLYIAVRFKGIAFAVPVIAALIHDVVITIGVYSVTGREVTESTVAAILTVLGYSIYDTIIIFDRIRENIPIMRRASFATIANVSLWETIRRSLATTFITLLPVLALFFFGGSTLKDFAFALLVGVTSGAYSSIFIAAPLLTTFKEREPEYARRKDEPLDGGLGRRADPAAGGGGCRRRAGAGDARSTRSSTHWTATPTRSAKRAGSGASRGPTAVPDSTDREALDRVVTMLGLRLDEARSLLDDVTSRWRGDALRVGEGSKRKLQDVARELGLVTREEWDELELRVAQIEHRLRLLEDGNQRRRKPDCYRASHGTRMGRAPVRSRLLHRTRDLDVRRS